MLATNLGSNHRGTVMPETNTKILVCNAGSSSFKFSLFDAEEEVLLAGGGIDWIRKPTRLVFRQTDQPEIRQELKLEKHADAAARILDDLQAGSSPALHSLEELGAVGHRVVHGGERYTQAVRITPAVEAAIADLAELAPLHNPANLEGIRAAAAALDGRGAFDGWAEAWSMLGDLVGETIGQPVAPADRLQPQPPAE